MEDNIGIPIDIDAKFFDSLERMENGLEKVQAITKQSGENISKSFDTKGADEQIIKLTKELRTQKEVMDGIAVSASKAFDPKNSQAQVKAAADVVKGLKGSEAELDKIYAQLQKLDKQGQDLIKNVSKAADAGDTEGIRNLLNTFQDGLDPELSRAFADEIEAGMKQAETAISRPSRELRELKRQISAGELEGEALTKATVRAAGLADEIGDVNQRIKNLSSDTFGVDAVVSGFEGIAAGASIAQGAVGLFGGSQEELEKSLLKVNSAMAILQGIQGVQRVLLEESAAKTAIVTAVEKARGFVIDEVTGKIKLQNLALLAGVGGAVIAGIALIASNWDAVSDALGFATQEQQRNNAAREEAIKSSANEVGQLRIAQQALNDSNTSQADRLRIINELKETYPNYLGSLNAESSSLKEINSAIATVNRSLLLKFEIQAREKQITADIEEQIIQQDLLNANIKFGAEAIARGDLTSAATFTAAAKESKAQLDAINERLDSAASKINQQKSSLAKFGGDPTDAKAAEDTKKESERIQKERESANKKELAEAEKHNDDLLKARQKFNDDFNALLDEADKAEIESLTGEDRILAQLSFDDQLLTLKENSLKETLNQLELSGDERIAKEKLIEDTIAEERKAIVKSASDQLVALDVEEAAKRAKTSEDALNREEQIILAREETKLNLQKESFATEEEFENAKQSALLNIQLQFAQRRLELLGGNLTEEQELQKAQLEKTISELQNSISDLKPKSQKRTPDSFLMELFGVDDKGLGQLKSSFEQAKQATLAFMAEISAAKIADIDAEIQRRDDNISLLEEQLGQENELKSNGKANSAALLEAEISEEKKKREDAVKEKQKLQVRQAKIDAAIQGSSLLTATIQILAAESSKGLIGIITAGSAIIAMFALIAKTRNQIKSVTQARKGHFTVLGGKSHEEGGTPVNGGIEAEKGEGQAIFSVDATKHYGAERLRAWTNAINTKRISMAQSAPSIQAIRNFEASKQRLEEKKNQSDSLKYLSELTTIRKDISDMKSKLQSMPDEIVTLPNGDVRIKKGNKVEIFRKAS